MPDLQNKLENVLKEFTPGGMERYPDILYPQYQGYSLSNIPSTVCHLLNVPGMGEPALCGEYLDKFTESFDKVVLVVVDALGYDLLNRFMDSGKADALKQRLGESVYAPMTSICPSTTCSALTTLWTGVSPVTHGVIGYEMWSKEYGMVINNILHSAMSFAGDTGGLRRAGFDPDQFLDQPTLGTHLSNLGVETDAFMHYSIGGSGLSTMHMKNVDVHGFISESDLWVSLRNKMNNNPGRKAYYYVYWSPIDTLTHRFGADDERLAHEFAGFIDLMRSVFMDELSDNAKRKSIMIITADHGSVVTPRYEEFSLKNHPIFNSLLRIQPTCENRLAFLYIKPGAEDAIRQYFDATWPGKFSIISSKQAFNAGLFGPGPNKSAVDDRVGDLVAIAHGDSYLWRGEKPNLMLGRHGGLHPDEMLIPFLAIPL